MNGDYSLMGTLKKRRKAAKRTCQYPDCDREQYSQFCWQHMDEGVDLYISARLKEQKHDKT